METLRGKILSRFSRRLTFNFMNDKKSINFILKVARRAKKMQLKLIQKYYNLTHKK